jgi:predicted GNAT family acetyltransferase
MRLVGGSGATGAQDAAAIAVADVPEQGRYEISVDGQPAGFTQYVLRPGLIAFVHTQIDERFQGRGLADRLIAEALDDARKRELAVLPFCPFVEAFIERHSDYLDLVPDDHRSRFGL